jgi:hypothetical protein
MARDPFSCKYSLKIKNLNICDYIPLIVVAPSSSNDNNYQPFKTSRVTETGTFVDTSTDTAIVIDTATDFETTTPTYYENTTATTTYTATGTLTVTWGFMRKP